VNNFQKVVQLNEAFGKGPVGWDWEKLAAQVDLVSEEAEELDFAVAGWDKEEVLDAAGDLLVVTYGLLHLIGVNADAVMEEISQSNFSKLIKNPDEAQATLNHYRKLKVKVRLGGMFPKTYVKVVEASTDVNGKHYPVGKFLKNVNWKSPDMGKFINVSD
jgi:phosphoribosyl-ATP pyrophosphohydrolase